MNEQFTWTASFGAANQPDEQRIGVVVGGSLSKGLRVRLDSAISVEQMAVGRYVVVHSTTGNASFVW
ncbi:MAG UNVERIFIED_CONTAM: hypothetical protein LVT10_05880 [Anaerolineae bacterium]|jgi:hypothetical protein